MAISYVGGKGAGTAGQGGGSISLTTGLTGGSGGAPIAGDLVVVTVSVGSQARTPAINIVTPSGYSPLTVQRTSATTYDTNVQTCYKIMGSTPDIAVTIPPSGNAADGISYTIQVFRGVNVDTPMDTTTTYATGSGVNNRPDPAAIQPVTTGAWILCCGGGAAAIGTTLYTASYLTNFLTYNGADTNDGTVGSGYYTGWTSGPYDPIAFGGGSVNAANSWGCTTIALRPVPVAYSLNVDPGNYTVSGVVAGALADRIMSALPSSYTITGSDTSLNKGLWLSAESGSYIISGLDAELLQGTTGLFLLANPGNYALTGTEVGLLADRFLNLTLGTYSVVGSTTKAQLDLDTFPESGEIPDLIMASDGKLNKRVSDTFYLKL